MILVATIVLVLIGIVHSYLGEKYILIRLFKRDNIPRLLGSDDFTKGTLRFCWHIMTVTAFGFAAILYNTDPNDAFTLNAIGLVFLLNALLAIFFTKGKHLSWIAFLIVSGVCFVQAYGG